MTTLLLAVIYIMFIGIGVPDSLFGVAWPAVSQYDAFDWEKLFPRYRAFYQRYSDDRYLYRNSADACIVWPTGTMHFCQPVPKISPCTDYNRNFGVFGFDQVQQECIVPVIWKRQPLYQPD